MCATFHRLLVRLEEPLGTSILQPSQDIFIHRQNPIQQRETLRSGILAFAEQQKGYRTSSTGRVPMPAAFASKNSSTGLSEAS